MGNVITLETGEALDLAAYPLPEGYDDAVFNREELARAMAVSTVTISKWVDVGMPVAERGGNGQSYRFVFSHCYAWRMWRQDVEAAERRSRNDKAAQLSMLFLNDEEAEDQQAALSPKTVREWAEAELVRNKAAEQRGELVRAAQVQEVLDTILASFRLGISGLPDWLEQEFSLSPHQVEKAERYCDGMLEETRRLITDAGFSAGAVVPISKPGADRA